MNVAYIRVSTLEQNEARQVEAMQKHNIDKCFTEKISGKNTDRPQLQAMLDFVRDGDTIFIHDFSRLSRSVKDLLSLVELLESKNVRLVSNKENLDTHTPTGKLMLTMIAAINEFERNNMLERQREGIAIAKQNGTYKKCKGRPLAVENVNRELLEELLSNNTSKSEIAKQLNISRSTLYNLLSNYK